MTEPPTHVMGIYDRDYERSYDTGSGWKDGGGGGTGFGSGGFADWSANAKLLAVIVGVYLAQVVSEKYLGNQGFTDFFSLPADWFREPWRVYGLVSYSLLHSTGNVYHVLFNGLALFFFGRTIEARVGGREYLWFFFAAAAFAALVWSGSEVAADGLNARSPTLIGASGGIAAIVVLFALWYPHVQVYLMGVLPVPAWLMAILFLAQDIAGALGRSGNVAYTAHLGGALFGYLYFRYGWRVSDWAPDWLSGSPGKGSGGFKAIFKSKPKLRVHRDDDEPETSGEDRVDEILRKIKSQGQDSLTREEQRVLEQASRRYKQRRH